MWTRLIRFFKPLSKKDKALAESVNNILGLKPININLYRLATLHSSVAKENVGGLKESNERLEYLGDAILSAVIADYLFKKFPYKDEGFLTEIRSRIVNRESLNQLGKKLGLQNIIAYNDSRKHSQGYKSISGDTLEAFIGAVYLDRGYRKCRNIIIDKLLFPHIDIDNIIKINPNFKSKIIEWAHRNGKPIRFEIVNVVEGKHFKKFIAQVIIDDDTFGNGTAFNKKRAEQEAAEQTCKMLNIH